ncbi:hypothetical protein L1887_15009 [Cichorium endivia]|nr:hypothetical protein L1887_15009 [Cichorium endivia]
MRYPPPLFSTQLLPLPLVQTASPLRPSKHVIYYLLPCACNLRMITAAPSSFSSPASFSSSFRCRPLLVGYCLLFIVVGTQSLTLTEATLAFADENVVQVNGK